MRWYVAHKILVPTTKVKVTIQGQRFVTDKLDVHNNLKTAEVNLIKFNTVVKHNEKMCCTQNLGSHNQGQGHSHGFLPHKSSIHNNSKRAEQM